MKLKKQIMPKNLEFKNLNFTINESVATLLTVISYPKVITPGFLANLSSMSGVKISIKNIPIPFALYKKLIIQELTELKQKYQQEKDRTLQEKLKQDNEALEQYLEMISKDQSKIFDFQMHILIASKDEEELAIKKQQIRSYLDAMGLVSISLLNEQETAFKCALPIFKASKLEKRIGTPMSSFTISALYPFVFDSIKDEGLSLLLGVDFSGGVILFNQFLYQIKKTSTRTDGNVFILGEKESGKTITNKLLVRSQIRNTNQVVAIDPKNEMLEMFYDYGGEIVDLTMGGEAGMLNPFEISPIMPNNNKDVVTNAINNVKALINYLNNPITPDEGIMFERICASVYKRYGITNEISSLINYKSNNFPTFSDVYQTLKVSIEAATFGSRERDAMEKLEIKIRPFVEQYKRYFDGHTNIELTSDLTAFNFKEIYRDDDQEVLKNLLYFNAVNYGYGLTLDKTKNTVFSIEEIDRLAENSEALNLLLKIQQNATANNTGNILITSKPYLFATSKNEKISVEIFKNASHNIVLNLNKRNVDALSRLVLLNDNEKNSIRKYGQGEGMFICGGKRMRINIVVTSEDLEAFGSIIF